MKRRIGAAILVCIAVAGCGSTAAPPNPTPPAGKDFVHNGVRWRETDIREVVEDFELMTPSVTYRGVEDPSRYLVRLVPLSDGDPDEYWLVECMRVDGRLIAHGQCRIYAKDGSELRREYARGEWID